jgi:hypothetical protein
VPIAKPWPLNEDGSKKDLPTDPIDAIAFFPYPYGDYSEVPLS